MSSNPKIRIRRYESAIEGCEQMIGSYREAIEHLKKDDSAKAHLAAYRLHPTCAIRVCCFEVTHLANEH